MIMMVCRGLVKAASRLECMACCNCSGVVRYVSLLPNHFVEKAGPNEPKILSLVKGENLFLKDVGHLVGDEKYECVRLNVVIRWLKISVGSVYWPLDKFEGIDFWNSIFLSLIKLN